MRISTPLHVSQLAGAPSTPPAGRRLLYPKSDGWYELDANGVETKLAAGATSVSWADILNKPATFPPDAHSHSYAATDHTHNEADLPLRAGAFFGTTGTAGRFDISHGLGQTPSAVLIQPQRGGWGTSFVDARTSTTFGVQIRNDSGTNAGGGQSGTLLWAAFK